MAGTMRIVVGMFFVIIGLLSLIILVGIFPLLIGMALIAWGADARRRELAEERQNQMMAQQTQILQQMAMSQGAQPYYPVVTEPTPSLHLSAPAEIYCQFCGAGNAWVSSYCHKCGKPLSVQDSHAYVDFQPSEER